MRDIRGMVLVGASFPDAKAQVAPDVTCEPRPGAGWVVLLAAVVQVTAAADWPWSQIAGSGRELHFNEVMGRGCVRPAQVSDALERLGIAASGLSDAHDGSRPLHGQATSTMIRKMSTGTQGVQPPPVQRSKMLLDAPAPNPALGFGPIAEAFASIIEASEPRFAIGIFGDWGSGKTTLMETIESKLDRDTAIPVRFNAWRYEREPELLVPLLDTIRQSLVNWAAVRPQGTRTDKAIKAARRIGRVVRALAAGASVEVGLVPGAKLTYDAAKAVDQLRDGTDSGNAEDQPQSLYFGGFTKLSEAVEEFLTGDISRIVVFVDDLDRCLPSSAIQVLEAMKLFFDLPGFVFVVGLDQRIIERAVASRFSSISPAATDAGVPSVSDSRDSQIRIAGEYLKKLFQVPYSLQPVLLAQLDELLDAMYAEAALESGQVDDLRSRCDHTCGMSPETNESIRARSNVSSIRIPCRPSFAQSYTLTSFSRCRRSPSTLSGKPRTT